MSADILGDQQFAFPKSNCDQLHAQTGMTLRDFFAAHALAGYLASFAIDGVENPPSGGAATVAYNYADAMIVERGRRDGRR